MVVVDASQPDGDEYVKYVTYSRLRGLTAWDRNRSGPCAPRANAVPVKLPLLPAILPDRARSAQTWKVNSGWAGSTADGARRSRFAPTADSGPVSRASKASSSKPAAVNHARTRGVRSGGRRCRVQMTVTRRAQAGCRQHGALDITGAAEDAAQQQDDVSGQGIGRRRG